MKMLVIACDASGAFRCAIVRNPDLFRRALARETGAASIVWVGHSLLAYDAGLMLTHLESGVLPHFTARPQLQHDPVFVAAMGWALLGRPLIAAAWRKGLWWVQGLLRFLSFPRYLRRFRSGQAGD
jgi:hypothetical protein